MAVAGLIVSIVAVLVSFAAVWYARVQGRAAAISADVEVDRRSQELTPQWRVSWEPLGEGVKLQLVLTGPPALGQLDRAELVILDDQSLPYAVFLRRPGGGPRPWMGAMKRHVWAPYQFKTGSFSRVSGREGFFGAPGPVGSDGKWLLVPTSAPSFWPQVSAEDWRQECGTVLRLRVDSFRRDWGAVVSGGED